VFTPAGSETTSDQQSQQAVLSNLIPGVMATATIGIIEKCNMFIDAKNDELEKRLMNTIALLRTAAVPQAPNKIKEAEQVTHSANREASRVPTPATNSSTTQVPGKAEPSCHNRSGTSRMAPKFDRYAIIQGMATKELNGQLGYITDRLEKQRWGVLVLCRGSKLSIHERILMSYRIGRCSNLSSPSRMRS